MPAHPFDHFATEIRRSRGRITERELIRRAVGRLTPRQRERFYSDSCYYYESREGPYDWLVEQASMFGVIAWDQTANRWQLGKTGPLYGRRIYRRRQTRSQPCKS